MSRWSKLALVVLVGGGSLIPLPSASAGGFCSGHGGERPTAERGVVVRMADNCFTPTVLYAQRGTTVRFVNEDAAGHTVGGAAGSFGDMHAPIGPGASVSHTFDEEGVFPYVCLLHPGMAGAIVVDDGGDADFSPAAFGSGETSADSRPSTEDASTDARPAPASASSAPSAVAVALLVVLAGTLVFLGLGARRRAGQQPAEREA
jgi:plastocyanin